jgi:hypothetical protein
MSVSRPLLLAIAMAGGIVLPASAQPQKEPIGKFAADFRAALARYPEDPSTVTALAIDANNLPRRGLGLSAGAHVYPFRLGKVTIGFGGEWVVAHGSDTEPPAQQGGPANPKVTTSFSVISPHVSLNFGSKQGWSYLSAGMGPSNFTTEREDHPVGDATSHPRAIHYGGGARWFTNQHLAFTFDLRFYRIAAQDATTNRPAYGGRRMLVLSGGISVK